MGRQCCAYIRIVKKTVADEHVYTVLSTSATGQVMKTVLFVLPDRMNRLPVYCHSGQVMGTVLFVHVDQMNPFPVSGPTGTLLRNVGFCECCCPERDRFSSDSP